MFTNILLAVDGSEHARRAAKIAGDLARTLKAHIHVIAVFEPVPVFLGEPNRQSAISERLHSVETVLEEALDIVGDVPTGCDSDILEGPPAEAILRVAETRGIDLIVMGARGRGRLGTLLLGSQSQKVVNQATCPVLLIR
ncbi:MAG: universal stress protein [Anaerolineae bacterium]|nr:MAG: universal stress protein [Anaerolineae bacterium]